MGRASLVVVGVLGVAALGCGRVGFDAAERGSSDDGGGGLALSYPRDAVFAVLGTTPVALVPTVSDPAARFTIEPALPQGLVLDAQSGAIAGTPTQIADEVTYTVVATRGAASASATLQLTVLPGYVVDTVVDANDTDNGVDTACASSSGCSLRAAVQTTNNRTAKQLVLLDAATYPLSSMLPEISNDVVIAGAGASATTIGVATSNPTYRALLLSAPRTLALRDLHIRDFAGTDGGAVAASAGTLDVDRCAFTNNRSPGSGGVLHITSGARARFAHTMFTGNASLGGSGGGWGGVINGEGTNTAIVVETSAATKNTTAWGAFSHITTGATLRLESSTLYDNTSTTAGTLATPGGIYTLVNTTIVNNHNTSSTANSAGIYLFSVPCSYTVTNSLIANNRDVNDQEYDCNRRDTATTITSGGGNLFGDAAANCATYFTAPGDRLSTDPLLDPSGAGDHGGPTPTILVKADSPAVDGAIDAACPARDQRGAGRPLGAHCDVGAVEIR